MQRKTHNTGAFQYLPELMQIRHVKSVAQKYGIDLKDTHVRIERDESLIGMRYSGVANHKHSGKGSIHLLPNAFTSEEELARTLFHEKKHLEQFAEFGYEVVMNNYVRFEAVAYEMEELFWKERGNK